MPSSISNLEIAFKEVKNYEFIGLESGIDHVKLTLVDAIDYYGSIELNYSIVIHEILFSYYFINEFIELNRRLPVYMY